MYTHAFAAHGRLDRTDQDVVCEDFADERRVFDLASLTKALVTTPLAFHHEMTRETVGGCLGEAAADLRAELRALPIASLLAHRSGLPAWRNWWVCRTELVEGLNRAADAIDPRLPEVYSDVGFLLLGLVIERVGGAGLAAQFSAMAREQLGFSCENQRFHYGTRLSGLAAEAVPTAFCAVRQRQLVGEVHDENCWSLGGETAHAGLFGSGPALVAFLRALYAAPLGRELIAANTAARLGWRENGGGSIGHMGFTGTAFWIYPERREYAILLTNRIVSARINPAIGDMRRAVFTAFGQRG